MIRSKYNRKTVSLVSLTDQATDILRISDARDFLRIDDADDALLTMLIQSAVESAERYLARAVRRQTLELTMDGFPFADDEALVRLGSGTFTIPLSYITGGAGEFDLPYAPANSVTSITTFSPGNVSAVFASSNYILNNSRVVLNEAATWPSGLRERAAVVVRYVAGYGPTGVPSPIKIGMMQHLAAMYDCRTGCNMPEAARDMMAPYRILDQLAW
jgi:hypothetical protein